LTQYVQCKIACKRILDFFESEELDDYVSHNDMGDGITIAIENVSAAWVLDTGNTITGPSPTKKSPDNYQPLESAAYDDKNADMNEGFSMELTPTVGREESTKLNRSTNTLMNISFQVPKGKLVAIVGSVGSGKSSLLSALLGEMHLLGGKINVVGDISYCDQRPWVVNASLKDNIIFGKEEDQNALEHAIEVTCLGDDIKILPGGIETEIGKSSIAIK
jgi:ABC-type multidrug transport system fused ATPase/permease subunit